MPIASLRSHTDALIDRLEAEGLRVGDARAPGEAPYLVVYPIPGGDFGGTLAAPNDDAELVRQVSCVGTTREQAEWWADRAIRALTSITVTGRAILRVEPEGPPGVFRDDDASPPVFVAPVRFRITSTPS